MPTFLLTWNPARWHWSNLAEVSEQTAAGTPYCFRWSTGNTRRITQGDRVGCELGADSSRRPPGVRAGTTSRTGYELMNGERTR